ncbi:hypothetical protein TUMSATVNIG1_60160 (plasmid) [Vibrio nigripulchritudo]|uniref:hypothetical protein n=1 Tax=Vibrio nigripulchritudo TaxID=28173 RepID=UPI00190E247A|nr:hypothetical protein [Vibrio nigripulchritudo]BCL74030.1 hypothetical protein VNTUMSATTG_59670 [Vibrio nigripulchritudo]BDU35407.1 hypothetical protein TUMSATVNIG1_60160 [Vibrio nigripulchritudo]
MLIPNSVFLKTDVKTVTKRIVPISVDDTSHIVRNRTHTDRDYQCFVLQESGYLLSMHVKEVVQETHGLVGESFAYIELSGKSLYFLVVSSENEILYETLYKDVAGKGSSIVLELKSFCDKFFEDKPAILVLSDGNQHLAKVKNDEESPHQDILGIHQEGGFFLENSLFLACDLKKETLLSRGGTDSLESDCALVLSAPPLVTEIVVHGLEKMHPNSVSIPFTKEKHKRRLKVAIACFSLAILIGTHFVYSFIEKQKSEESRLSAEYAARMKAAAKVDPYKEYRQTVLDPESGTRAIVVLEQIAYFLKSFENVSTSPPPGIEVLNWSIEEVEARGPLISLIPKRDSGNIQNLQQYADYVNAQIWSDREGVKVSILSPKASITTEFKWHPSIEEELNYLNDSLSWLSDEVKVTGENRIDNGIGKGKFKTLLAKVEFSCWLPENILYASTQLHGRVYGFHTFEASREEDDSCGYSGNFKVEIHAKDK